MERVKGLVKELVEVSVPTERVFKVEQFECEHCGTKNEFKDTDEKLCPECHNKVEKKSYKDVSYDEVEKILKTETVWKCEDCGRTYNIPQICCNAKYMARVPDHLSDRQAITIEGDKPFTGFMCDGCKTLYARQTRCCTGSLLIQGTIYPNPDQKTLLKLNSLKVNAITGVIQ